MKNKEQFEKTVATLTKAYFNNTLRHGYCTACAVGNLVAEALGLEVSLIPAPSRAGYGLWTAAFSSITSITDDTVCKVQEIRAGGYKGAAKMEIDSTGYSMFQLAAIEKAFESKAALPKTLDELSRGIVATSKEEEVAMFEGLCAVYDVLCIIHEVTEEDNVTRAELVFVK